MRKIYTLTNTYVPFPGNRNTITIEVDADDLSGIELTDDLLGDHSIAPGHAEALIELLTEAVKLMREPK